MESPTSPDEAEVRAAVLALLHDWVDSSPEAIERFLGAVRPSFTGYGTGPGDYYADRDDLRAMVEREHAGMSFPFTLDVPWMTVHVLDETAAVAVGEIAVTVDMGNESVVEAPRFTFALTKEEGRWRLAHFHFSIPDAIQKEGDTMDDVLTARTRQLEEEVARRTAELAAALDDLRATQDRLVQSEKLAGLGRMTAGIAHEIKNPLNFVTNFASLSRELLAELAEETDPDEREALLADLATNAEKIEGHGRRADAIVRSMMAHARNSSGERRAVDINGLVAEYAGHAVHAQRARRPDVEVGFVQELAGDVGTAEVVPQEIGRVLVNLLDNAFDAVRQRADETSEGYAPAVTVSTSRADGRVAIRVQDNGSGMSETVRQRLFEPFFTTKPTGQGTGLGLSLSHDIVVQGHRGALDVESTDGAGSTFVIALPAA